MFCVQNDEDDWQENEELRAIEGLEGECGPLQDKQRNKTTADHLTPSSSALTQELLH